MFLVLGAAACGGPWDDVSFVDEGELCFTAEAGEVHVQVSAPDCLSSCCSRRVGGSCSATVEGRRIEVTSEIHWEQHPGGRITHPCTSDCGDATVECAIGALADGSYTVVLGDEATPLVVPVEPSCPL